MSVKSSPAPSEPAIAFRLYSSLFVVASSSILDPLATTVFDDEHSEKEERWVTIGVARNGMHFVLVHTWQPTGQNSATARIISARRAVRAEILEYQENLE